MKKKINDLISINKGKKPNLITKEQENGYMPYVDIKAFEQKIIDNYTDGEKCQPCEDGDLLIVCDGSRSGLVGRAIKGYVGSTLARIDIDSSVLPEYIYHFIQGRYVQLNTSIKGTGTPHLNQELLKSFELYVPSLEEQHRIVTRIEELFSQLDSGVETLKKTKEQLKVYRQAILSEAFPTLSKANKKLLYEIAEISGGITKGRKLSPNDSIELPYLRVANVQNGYLNLSQIKTIQLKKTEREKYLLKFGDVLYTEGGDRDKLGRGTVWKDEVANCVHQNHIFKARINNSLAIPEYIAYWSMAGTAREYFYKNGKQTVNLASINKTVLSNLPIPIVPLELQYKTIKEIESRLSVCDSIEKTIDTALQEAEALRQSILKQAFEGGL
ncbi:restriction endonuclease subunit S [Ruminococcus sp.]|uniref:restriction endonuclease subunit S n=1 Tax=Ruminococcus sp. TaxID=41978 RepID=UPI0025F29637|nr:restriction endonuclease subunit S [Ruminococcus sp.]